MTKKQQPSLALFAEKFASEQPALWMAICNSSHSDPAEQKAVARAIVKDILTRNASRYINAFYAQVNALYSGRPFAAYNITALYRELPTFAKRASKKREKTVLGWVHCFLIEADEQELLTAFEARIAESLPN